MGNSLRLFALLHRSSITLGIFSSRAQSFLPKGWYHKLVLGPQELTY
jgi:hypothetical protein